MAIVMTSLPRTASGWSRSALEKATPAPGVVNAGRAWLSRVARHQAAVDGDHRAGEEGGRRQAQAERHMRDFLGIAIAAECSAALGVDGLVLFGNAVGDGSADRAGADAVDGDALAAELDCQRAGEARDAALGRRVGAVQSSRAERLGRGDVDDARALRFAQ